MTFQTYLIPVAAVVGTLVAGPALAATAKATVDAAKAAGIVGEQNDGYLGFVRGGGAAPAVEAAVGEINAGRAQLYRGAAAKNGVTPEAAGAAAYQSVVQLKLRPGDFYQTPAGAWIQK
ncbi:YdbL family protein [Phenylobacterium sp.]|uniref:YdbL family protein n=1 Tax=Phenylobacterium sp. TaxID=1871053 RepID=UPI00286DE06F|nr:YdbL family protein [Phenylobacterium sp.]